MMNKISSYVMAAVLCIPAYSTAQATPVDYQGTFGIYDMYSTEIETRSITGSIDFDAMSMSVNTFDLMALPVGFTTLSLYGPGSYSFYVDSQVQGDLTSPGYMDMTVSSGQIGAFGLFDWNVTTGMGAAFVWDVSYGGTVESPVYILTAADPDGDGIPGTPQVDGPFLGISAAMSLTTAPVPVPAAVWLFGSGLIALLGFVGGRRKR